MPCRSARLRGRGTLPQWKVPQRCMSLPVGPVASPGYERTGLSRNNPTPSAQAAVGRVPSEICGDGCRCRANRYRPRVRRSAGGTSCDRCRACASSVAGERPRKPDARPAILPPNRRAGTRKPAASHDRTESRNPLPQRRCSARSTIGCSAESGGIRRCSASMLASSPMPASASGCWRRSGMSRIKWMWRSKAERRAGTETRARSRV